MPAGSNLLPGTAVVVRSGTEHAQSIWQVAIPSAVTVGTGQQQWVESYTGKDPIKYTANNGVQLNGTEFSVKLGASLGSV